MRATGCGMESEVPNAKGTLMRTTKVRRMLIVGLAAGLLTLSGAGSALAHDIPPEESQQHDCVTEAGHSAPDDAADRQDNECGERSN